MLLGVGTVFGFYANQIVRRSVLANTEASLSQVATNFDSFIRYAESLSFSLLLNQELQQKFSTPPLSTTDIAVRRLEMTSILSRQFFLEDFIQRIYLVDRFGIYSNVSLITPKVAEAIRRIIQDEGNRFFISQPYQAELPGSIQFELGTFIAIGRPFRQLGTQNQLGHIIIEMNYRAFQHLLDAYETTTSVPVVIFDNTGKRLFDEVYGSRDSKSLAFDSEISQRIQTSLLGVQNIQGQNVVITLQDSTGWYLVARVPSSIIDVSTRALVTTLIAMVLVLFIISSILSHGIAGTITKPILFLQESMKEIHYQPIHLQVQTPISMEIRNLYSEFNQMNETISSLFSQVQEDTKAQYELEMLLLQNRINPHFLYNTLESFTWLAQMHDLPILSQALSKLIRLLRSNVYSSDTFLSLQAEISFMKDYVSLLAFIKGIEIELKIEAEPHLLEIPILRMIVQPFVENAIFHGILGFTPKGEINLKVQESQEFLEIMIEDNGKGFAPVLTNSNGEDMTRIENQTTPGYSGIGIENVKSRLILFYGKEASVNITLRELGTSVTILVPKILPNPKSHPLIDSHTSSRTAGGNHDT